MPGAPILEPDLSRLASVLREWSSRRPLIVGGKTSYAASGGERMVQEALGTETDCMLYQEFSPNPNLSDLAAAIERVAPFGADAVVGIGGGSSLDFAKLIAAGFESADECATYLRGHAQRELSPLPIAAVPTTAGSGSECTHFAVVYEGKKKYSLAHPRLLPMASFLVPTLTTGLSEYMTASSALDALCQAIESLWAKGASAASRDDAREAIPRIVRALPAVLAGAKEGRGELLVAAHYAGRAINVSKTTAPHALSYRIAGLSGIGHGHSVAITMAPIMRAALKIHPTPLPEVWELLARVFGVADAANVPSAFDDFFSATGLPTTLRAVGIDGEHELVEISESVNIERLRNHPFPLRAVELLDILRSVA